MLYMTAADALITRLERQGALPVLAADHGDPRGRHGRQSLRRTADPNWLPLIPTPPYTEHSSGHGGLSGSFVATLQDFFGTDQIGWTDTNNGGLTRSFTRFSQAIDEIVDARVWSGIHFHTADEQGTRSAGRSRSGASGTTSRPRGTTTRTEEGSGGSRFAARPALPLRRLAPLPTG